MKRPLHAVLGILILFWILLVVLLLVFPSLSDGEEITLEWDQPDGDIDGVRIFMTVPAQDETGAWHHEYDYINPLTTPLYQDGNIPPTINSVTVDLPGRPDKITKYLFVARAFRGQDESIDSNEVDHKVNLIPPIQPVELTGEYNIDEQIISLSWEQPPDDWEISHWAVYYRVPEHDWVELGTVDHGQELTISQQLTLVEQGQQQVVDFAVVAFRKSGVFSSNSNEFSVAIDRREVPSIENLRISVEIPL